MSNIRGTQNLQMNGIRDLRGNQPEVAGNQSSAASGTADMNTRAEAEESRGGGRTHWRDKPWAKATGRFFSSLGNAGSDLLHLGKDVGKAGIDIGTGVLGAGADGAAEITKGVVGGSARMVGLDGVANGVDKGVDILNGGTQATLGLANGISDVALDGTVGLVDGGAKRLAGIGNDVWDAATAYEPRARAAEDVAAMEQKLSQPDAGGARAAAGADRIAERAQVQIKEQPALARAAEVRGDVSEFQLDDGVLKFGRWDGPRQKADRLQNLSEALHSQGVIDPILTERLRSGIKSYNKEADIIESDPYHNGQVPEAMQDFGDPYVIKRGDTFNAIADRMGVDRATLRDANPHITDFNKIGVGDQLMIPQKGVDVEEMATTGVQWQSAQNHIETIDQRDSVFTDNMWEPDLMDFSSIYNDRMGCFWY